MNLALLDFFYAGEEWARLRKPSAAQFAARRLKALAKALGDKPYLDGDRFTVGDLMMSTVLRIVPELLTEENLRSYLERCTARAAFKRALGAQLGDFKRQTA